MPLLRSTVRRLQKAEVLSGVPISNELRRRIKDRTATLSRPPCLAVVLVGDRADSIRYINHKRRAAAVCGIAVRLVQLPTATKQAELHSALAAVNNDVEVDGVLLQLPLPPHLRARPALFHIHPGKDVDGLHPLNAGNLFLQDQSPLLQAFVAASSTQPDTQAQAMTDEMLLLAANGGLNTLRRRSHESKFFVPCTALAIRTILFSYLSRRAGFAHLLPAAHSNNMSKVDGPAAGVPPSAPSSPSARAHAAPSSASTASASTAPRPDLHAVIVNKSMVVGVPTAALLQRAGGFVVTLCSRSNSLESIRRVTQQADVLITAYGAANVFDSSFVRPGAIVVDAAINELPTVGDGDHDGEPATEKQKMRLCGDVDLASVASVAAAVTKTPGGVGPLTVSHLMFNVLKAYQLRHANHLYYNNIYTEFLKMYGTHEKVRDYAPHLGIPSPSSRAKSSTALTTEVASTAVSETRAAAPLPPARCLPADAEEAGRGGDEGGDEEEPSDDTDADNESYGV